MVHMRRVIPIAIAVLYGACAGNPQPGDPGYAYNLSGAYDATYDLDVGSYSGTIEMETARGGVVTGKYLLINPDMVEGSISGTIVGDAFTYSGPYERHGGCGGTVTGAGVITEGGTSVSGEIEIEDDCSGPIAGTYSFDR